MYPLADPGGGGGHQGQMPLPQESGEGIQCKYAPPASFSLTHQKSTYKKAKNEILFLFMVINLQDASMISFLVAITHESIVMYLLLDFAATYRLQPRYITKTNNLQPTSREKFRPW